MACIKRFKTSRAGLSSLMATVIMAALTIAIVVAASFWSSGLIAVFTRYDNVEIKNTYVVSRDSKNIVYIQYENVGSASTNVNSVLLNGEPYTSYTPVPKLGGDLSPLPSPCEIGASKSGTITFEESATDQSGNRLTYGDTLLVTISTDSGKQFQAWTIIPSADFQSSVIQGSSIIQNSSTPLVKTKFGTRFRLGATIASSTVREFGKNHGVNIKLDYSGGQTFYNYMTKGPGFFAHIDFAMGLPNIKDWSGTKKFLKGLLDSADADNGRCEISISLYGVDLGWVGFWERPLLEILDAIGPNRPSLRFIFLKSEWSYKNRMPPTYDKLNADFIRAKQMVESYNYQLGWADAGKYDTNIAKTLWPTVQSWGPDVLVEAVSHEPDLVKGPQKCYVNAHTAPGSTDVFLLAFTMWDTNANIPNTPPYYVTYDKVDAYLHGAADRFDALNGSYPQSVMFDVMPETFNDVQGVNCPYLDWWFGPNGLAQKYNLRTSQTPPVLVPRQPDVPSPQSPFPQYPVDIKIGNQRENLPPFMVQVGGQIDLYIQAVNLHTGNAYGNKHISVYLVKQPITSGVWVSGPITKDMFNNRIFIGNVITKLDGWVPSPVIFTLNPSLGPGKYTLIATTPSSDNTAIGISDFMEYIIVVPTVHMVEIRSNVNVAYHFGPTCCGPPWQGCDSGGSSSPSNPMRGWCGEMNWTFVAPASVKTSSGQILNFKYWLVGSQPVYNSILTVMVDRDLILTVEYGP